MMQKRNRATNVKFYTKSYRAGLSLTLPMPHRVSISAVTLPTPPIPTTATEKFLIFYNKHITHKQSPQIESQQKHESSCMLQVKRIFVTINKIQVLHTWEQFQTALGLKIKLGIGINCTFSYGELWLRWALARADWNRTKFKQVQCPFGLVTSYLYKVVYFTSKVGGKR